MNVSLNVTGVFINSIRRLLCLFAVRLVEVLLWVSLRKLKIWLELILLKMILVLYILGDVFECDLDLAMYLNGKNSDNRSYVDILGILRK